MACGEARKSERPSEWFQTTHWTLIEAARTLDDERRREVLGAILARYWKPVWAYLRWNRNRRPRTPEEAEDLTQGFFCEIVLGKGLIPSADRVKGRFRTFLLTALDRYVVNVHRHRSARVRSPAGRLLPLEWDAPAREFEPLDEATPQRAFLRAWAAALLDDALAEVEAECLQAGQSTHWAVFQAQVLGPIMNAEPAPPIDRTCRRLGIDKPKAAHNMAVTVKRRFRRILEERVRAMVAREEDVEAEIRDLIEALSGPGADA
jgi:RNA polymerase sigma-70 factor (ECF subfamily)